jgi:hypothetical protein
MLTHFASGNRWQLPYALKTCPVLVYPFVTATDVEPFHSYPAVSGSGITNLTVSGNEDLDYYASMLCICMHLSFRSMTLLPEMTPYSPKANATDRADARHLGGHHGSLRNVDRHLPLVRNALEDMERPWDTGARGTPLHPFSQAWTTNGRTEQRSPTGIHPRPRNHVRTQRHQGLPPRLTDRHVAFVPPDQNLRRRGWSSTASLASSASTSSVNRIKKHQ